jgi:hypothetical protein
VLSPIPVGLPLIRTRQLGNFFATNAFSFLLLLSRSLTLFLALALSLSFSRSHSLSRALSLALSISLFCSNAEQQSSDVVENRNRVIEIYQAAHVLRYLGPPACHPSTLSQSVALSVCPRFRGLYIACFGWNKMKRLTSA